MMINIVIVLWSQYWYSLLWKLLGIFDELHDDMTSHYIRKAKKKIKILINEVESFENKENDHNE